MTRDEAVRAAREAGLGALAERVEEFLHPSIRLRPTRERLENLPLGASRFGGVPDWPAGSAWPARDGRPLAFLAQIRMADCLRFAEAGDLRCRGWLYFFYDAEQQPWGFDPADRGGWHVLHADGPLDDFERAVPPAANGSESFAPCQLDFEIEYRLPPAEVVCGTLELEFDEQQERAFDALFERVNRPGDNHHRMFGWPDEIQGDMRLECQLVSNGLYCGNSSGYEDPKAAELESGQQDWVLLLQVDSDEERPGWLWGDCGRIYFWIREQDLESCALERVWLILQCF